MSEIVTARLPDTLTEREYRWLTSTEFGTSVDLNPRMVVELVITNHKNEILLVERDKEPFKGQWHLPGGFVMKNEPLRAAEQRIAWGELNFDLGGNLIAHQILDSENKPRIIWKKSTYFQTSQTMTVSEHEQLGFFENIGNDPRAHLYHTVFGIHMNVATRNSDYFTEVPAYTIPFQKILLQQLGFKVASK